MPPRTSALTLWVWVAGLATTAPRTIQTSPAAVPSQDTAVVEVSVAQARADGDGDFVPDLLGRRVRVQGTIISSRRPAGSLSDVINLQDEDAGIVLFTRDTLAFVDLAPGDVVEVMGVVGQDDGMEEVEVDEIRRIRSGPPPDPLPVSTSDLRGERYSGMLVTVAGTLRATFAEGRVDASLTDEAGTVSVYIRERFLRDADFLSRLVHASGSVRVVGIASQSDPDPPFDSEYDLLVRGASDFMFPPPVPLFVRWMSGALAALAVALVVAVALRNREVRRARELILLNRRLGESEQAVRESESRFRALTEKASDLITVVQRDGEVTYDNPSVTHMLGYTEFARVGDPLWQYVHADDAAELEDALEKAAAGEGVVAVDARFQAVSGGWRRMRVTVTDLLEDPSVEGLVLNCRDVTEERRLEEKAREAERLESLSVLLGGIAKEFDDVLSGVRESVGRLSAAAGEGDARRSASEISESLRRAGGIVQGLQAFGRRLDVHPDPVDVAQALDTALPRLQRVAGGRVDLEVFASGDLPPVLFDARHLHEIMVQLIENARDAMPEGGRVNLLVDRFETPVPFPVVGGMDLSPGAYVRVRVQDSGAGMSPEVAERAFEPFFTTKGQDGTKGLGLPAVFGLVRQLGGGVRVVTGQGEGCEVTMYLWSGEHESAPRARP